VVKYLGRGACGKVFLCLNTQDLRLYAMKVGSSSSSSRDHAAPPSLLSLPEQMNGMDT
jgi:hypothetical protein